MSSSELMDAAEHEVLSGAAEVLERCAADSVVADALDPSVLQRLLAASVRAYVRRLENGDRMAAVPPVETGLEPTATEVMVAVTQLLAACQIELFELGMWQTWGSVRLGSLGDGDER